LQGHIARTSETLLSTLRRHHIPVSAGSTATIHQLVNPEGLHITLPSTWDAIVRMRGASLAAASTSAADVCAKDTAGIEASSAVPLYFSVRSIRAMTVSDMTEPHMFDGRLYSSVRFVLPVDVFWDADMTEPVELPFPHISVACYGVIAGKRK
jgi:hypothetical protein